MSGPAVATVDGGAPVSARVVTPQEAIEGVEQNITVSDRLHGFGGLHGGIGVAIATRRLVAAVDDETKPLRSLHARFLRPIRESLSVEDPRHTSGRLVDTATISLETAGKPALSVAATFARGSMNVIGHLPSMPDVDEPGDCDEFELPVEFVPFGEFIEIRPTTDDRPFAAGPSPRLQAWVRLREDQPVDLARLVVLMDALAPSAAASLSEFVAIPSVELTVRPSPNLADARSPWVLLDAESNTTDDGWVDETISAWAPDGDHLGTATQLRVMIGI